MTDKRNLTISGLYENVPRATEFVAQAARDAGLEEKAVFHCQMAVDEACTNIIEHAYGGEGKGEVQITVHIDPGSLTITLIDHGAPFDPASVSQPVIDPDPANVEPGGLGLHLMRETMDEVTFTFAPDHNKLVMVKRQPSESD